MAQNDSKKQVTGKTTSSTANSAAKKSTPKKKAANPAKKPLTKSQPSKGTKTSGKTRKTTAKKKTKPSSGTFKWVLICMLAFAVILAVLIIQLDKRAVEKGQIGLWETISNVEMAHSLKEVDQTFNSLLRSYSPENIQLEVHGRAPSRRTQKLEYYKYKILSEEFYQDLAATYEVDCGNKGITVHNRYFSKSGERWKMVFFLGTPTERTHKIEFNFYVREKSKVATKPKPLIQTPAIALVIDDFGQDLSMAKRFLAELDVPLTFAIIPFLKDSAEIRKIVQSEGQTAFLHLPMEPMDASQMKDDDEFLRMDMSEAELRALTTASLESLGKVDGVNNHMGSRLTSDKRSMEIVLDEIKQHGLPFLDSRTIASSVAAKTASELKLPHWTRDIFIDQGYAGGDVAANLESLCEIARTKKFAVGIGHATQETLEILKVEIPKLQKQGIHVVSIIDSMRGY